MVRLYTKDLLYSLSGSAYKVCVGGGWVVWGWGWVVVESKLSDRLWFSFSLALAKPNKIRKCIKGASNEMHRKGCK